MKNLHTHKKTIGWMVLVFFAFSVSMILYIERLQYRQPSIYDLTMITNNSDTSKLLLNKVCKSSRNTDVNQLSLTYENVSRQELTEMLEHFLDLYSHCSGHSAGLPAKDISRGGMSHESHLVGSARVHH